MVLFLPWGSRAAGRALSAFFLHALLPCGRAACQPWGGPPCTHSHMSRPPLGRRQLACEVSLGPKVETDAGML